MQAGFAVRFWRALRADDTDLALRELQAYLEELPSLRYATDGRRIVKAGIGFSVEKRAMTGYIIED